MAPVVRGRLIGVLKWVVVCAALTVVQVEYAYGVISVVGGLIGLLGILAALGILVGAGVWIWRRSTLVLRWSGAIFACVFASLWAAVGIDGVQSRRSVAVGNQVVEALERFHGAEGRYPESLDELTPAYLAGASSTCMGIRGRPFLYSTKDGGTYYLGFDRTSGRMMSYRGKGQWIEHD